MNKLTALYEVMKNVKKMKGADDFKVSIDAEVKFAEDIIATLEAYKEVSKGKHNKKATIKFGDEFVEFENSTSVNSSFELNHENHHKGMHHGIFSHGMKQGMCNHGMNYSEMKGHSNKYISKFDRGMMMIKLLDKINFKETEDNRKILSLELKTTDLPEKLQAHMKDHLAYKHEHLAMMKEHGCEAHHEKMTKFLKTSGLDQIDTKTVMPEKVNLIVEINENNQADLVKVNALVKSKLNSGKEKKITISISAKML
ncbi:hypothetical protein [Helicovermis profundi]|uniref:Uncharacterized protein n=1 Tax=Helicovermis profundi TaxID=3065157 RepID=A0AAU9E5F5_9FIRM|nr:hypothetical protein HLPR_01480 [Clostridia bacterium S502]